MCMRLKTEKDRVFMDSYPLRLLNKVILPTGFQINMLPKKLIREVWSKRKGNVLFEQIVSHTSHEVSYVDFECRFASNCISKYHPSSILDIGSYRHFLLGLLGHYKITTVDIRSRDVVSSNECVVVCDAKKLDLLDGSFDLVLSLCALEHFGLGRYGDAVDFDADRMAMEEFKRVLKPGGHLVLSTGLTSGPSVVVLNSGRYYNLGDIHGLCSGLVCEREEFYNLHDFVNDNRGNCVYAGCWRKP
jgi:SAM-dependent methyltransferase